MFVLTFPLARHQSSYFFSPIPMLAIINNDLLQLSEDGILFLYLKVYLIWVIIMKQNIFPPLIGHKNIFLSDLLAPVLDQFSISSSVFFPVDSCMSVVHPWQHAHRIVGGLQYSTSFGKATLLPTAIPSPLESEKISL